jgi:hypothetical protein
VYLGRFADAEALLEPEIPGSLLAVNMQARFALWRGERARDLDLDMTKLPPAVKDGLEAQLRYCRTHTLTPEDVARLIKPPAQMSQRYRAANSQFLAELFAHAGDADRALDFVEMSVDSGLQDRQWIWHCPLLATLRAHPRFVTLAKVVEQRAELALAAVREAQAER